MVRTTNWTSSVAVGLIFAWQAVPAHSEQVAAQVESAAAPAGHFETFAAQRERPADFISELPSEDEQSRDEDEQARDPRTSSDTDQAADDTDRDVLKFGRHGASPKAHDATANATASGTEVINERFPNGALKIEREVTQDAQGNYLNHGIWKMWDQRGNLMAQGEYNYGQRSGTWTRWYRNANEAGLLSKMPYRQYAAPYVSQATFKDGKLEGNWLISDGHKHKISELKFRDGRRDGMSTWWYLSGQKMLEIQYNDGELDGHFSEWSPAGAVVLKDTYQHGRKLAAKRANHPGGTKKSEGTYLFAKEMELTADDWWNCRFQTSSSEGKAEKHGAWGSWYANGRPQLEGSYDHDLQAGQFTWWHSNGQKLLEGRFEHGKQDGPWTWWYSSGQKKIQGDYARGTPTGRWTWWNEDGKVAQAADLSQSDGVAVDMPSVPDMTEEPHAMKPPTRLPAKRK